jgi:hypothetical protein
LAGGRGALVAARRGAASHASACANLRERERERELARESRAGLVGVGIALRAASLRIDGSIDWCLLYLDNDTSQGQGNALVLHGASYRTPSPSGQGNYSWVMNSP